MISNLYYEMDNVKGADCTKERGAFNKDRYMEKYYKLSNLVHEYETENTLIEAYTDNIKKIFSKITDPGMQKAIRDEFMLLK